MARYKTKYFGDFEADDDKDVVEIETSVREGGEDKDVSIIVHYFDYKDQIDDIVAAIDNYFEMHGAAKAYIEKNYTKDTMIADFLFNYAGQVLRQEYERKGGRVFSIDLDTMIRHLDPPSVSFQKSQSGKILAHITYYCPDVDNASLTVVIDKECRIYTVECRDYR
jgi:hypothetical protein